MTEGFGLIGTLLTLAGCAIAFFLARWWWRDILNPVALGVLAWMPGLILLNWPPFFLSPIYIHLNRPVSENVFIALVLGFLSFWGGCATIKLLSPRHAYERAVQLQWPPVHSLRALGLFVIGFAVWAFSYIESGLLDLASLDDQQIAQSQLNLHLGLLSFLILFMDMAVFALFARFLKTGSLVNLIPLAIAMACYAATLQKSPLVWLVIGCVFIAALYREPSRQLFWSTPLRRMMVVSIAVGLLMTMLAMNQARGVAVVQITAASGPLLEQAYIYSGASAIMNLSVTIDGYLPSDPPLWGGYLARPILWHFLDRDLFSVGRYFGGVNTGTYLVYGWADFRWIGFAVTPFVTGMIVMLFLRMAMRGTLLGILFGAIAIRAVALSPFTDVLFDPLTSIILVIAVAADLLMRTRYPARTVAPLSPPPSASPDTGSPPVFAASRSARIAQS